MLKNLIKWVLAKQGLKLERSFPPLPEVSDDVRRFVERMWPVTTDIPLVRIGGNADGAYMVPDDLDGITALFSPGVDVTASFEAELAARGVTCYMADASVEETPLKNDRFVFDRKFIGLSNTDIYTTLDSWVNKYEPGSHDLILQMDVEGAEWTALSNMSDDLLKRFRVILIELHSMTNLLDKHARVPIMQVLDRILASHMVLHNHPNNWSRVAHARDLSIPDLMEVTFLRRDRARPVGYATTFPHSLDVTNQPLLPPLALPTSWYSPSSTLEPLRSDALS